jgi:tetratricopeptide (TPR) repeat protein
MSPEELRGVDIARLNLLCAEGLPGAEGLDAKQCLSRLDDWAQYVQRETERHLYRVADPRYAEQYRKSESYFRASMMLQILQEDCGVHYNKQRIRDIDFKNSRDLFLHGMVGSDNGGTCVSMPVLYVAVGRRLGYPMRLVLAKGRVFARWDDPACGERFNIEGSGEGFSSFPDDHYKTWPMSLSAADLATGHYLKSLEPAEELAVFLAARGHCLEDTGRLPETRLAYAQAHRLDPKSAEYLGFLVQVVGGPSGRTRTAGSGRADASDPMAELRRIEAINAYNRRLMEQGLRGMPAGPGAGLQPNPLSPGPVVPPS